MHSYPFKDRCQLRPVPCHAVEPIVPTPPPFVSLRRRQSPRGYRSARAGRLRAVGPYRSLIRRAMMELGLDRTTSLMTEEISMQTMDRRKHLFGGAVPDPKAIRLPAVVDDAVFV